MTNETSIWYPTDENKTLKRSIRFWIFLIADPPAILCTVFVLYHLLTKKILRQTLNNHVLIVLLSFALLYQIIDIPLHLQFLFDGFTRPSIPLTCLVWWFIDWGFFYVIAALFVFASIERHIFIFHSYLFIKRRNRFLLHYFPLFSIVTIVLGFYIIVLFTPICENEFDYSVYLCGTHACYGSIPVFIFIEQVIFSALNSCLVAIFSLTLLIRVIWQKFRARRFISWRKQRRLAIQTISLALLYLICSFPLAIIYIVRLYFDPNWAEDYISVFFFFTYFPILLLPYLCLGSIPRLSKTFPQTFRLNRLERRI